MPETDKNAINPPAFSPEAMPKFIVKTPLNMEYIAASHLMDRGVKVTEVRPSGFFGLLLAESSSEEELNVPEVENVIPVLVECEATLESITSTTNRIVEKMREMGAKSFDVKARVRGKKPFRNRDVTSLLSQKIAESGFTQNWIEPDVTVCVEVIGNKAYIGIVKGVLEHRKYLGKEDSTKLFGKVSIVQMPYLEKKAYEFGEAIGRAAQAFEVRELVIAPCGYVNAFELEQFLRGVRVGQKSRLEIQKKAYSRDVRETSVLLHDLYQCVRDKRRKRNLIIVTDPAGVPVSEIHDELARKIKMCDEIVILAGSRSGIPKGVFRFADYVIDLAPNVTFATEHTIPAILSVLAEMWVS